jgi:tetratricopeptide (TPR) repeat protein
MLVLLWSSVEALMDEHQRDCMALRRLIALGEGEKLEFKAGLGIDRTSGTSNPKIVHAILKTVAAFLNTDGGTLLIGVSDTGVVRGVEHDYALLDKKNADGFQLRLRQLLHSSLDPPPLSGIKITFHTLSEGTVCMVDVSRNAHVVHVKDKEVYVRDGNTTRKLDGRELTDWVSKRPARRRVRLLPLASIGTILTLILSYILLKPVAALPTKPSRPGVDEPLHPCALPGAPPENPSARLAYSEGCQKISVLDYPAARPLLEKAASIEPQNPAIRLALADTLSWLGYDERASQECNKAMELSKDLSPEPALWIHGRCYAIGNDFDKAITTYRALWALSPENLQYGLQLVDIQTDDDDGKAALTTIDRLRKLPRPARDDPRIDLAEASAAELLDDTQRQRAAAEAALNKSQSPEQRLLAAEAKRWLGTAYKDLGEPAKARVAFRDAKDTFDALGDRLGAALTQQELAELLQDQGDVEEALVFYKEVVRFYTQIGNRTNLASALSDIADVLTTQGDVPHAIAAYDKVLAATSKARSRSETITALIRKGDLLVWLGNLSEAKKLYQDAVAIAHVINQKTQEADALDSFARLLIKEGNLTGATRACQEIRALNEAVGRTSTQTGTWRSFGDLLLETGQAAQAETLARAAAQEAANDQSLQGQAAAEDIQALSFLAQGEGGKAKEVIARAAGHAEESKDLHVRLSTSITRARIRDAQGDPLDAERDLVGVLAETKKVGFLDLQLDATLARGELQMRHGDQDRARALLTALAEEATAHGFRLIAKKAANTSRRPR